MTRPPEADADDRLLAAELEREREARAHAEAAERRATFLATVSEILGSSLEIEETVPRVAQAALPLLGDCCSIELIGPDRTFQPLAVAHVDPARVDEARELMRL